MKEFNVYLLSIGINNYLSDRIENLEGCVDDVLNFQSALFKLNITSLKNCKTICNENATRENIIQSFLSHFSQLQNGDIALLHFSGHGSSEPTNPEFITAGYENPGGRNETLVCHDSKCKNVYNIADKELRLLIAKIQKNKKQTEFIGIFDCCHSGSILRNYIWKVKATKGNQLIRPLDKYLDGEYKKMFIETKKILIPPINYIALSACSPKEYAFEDNKGGMFTNSLIEILNQNPFLPSYSELHSLSQGIVQSKSNNRQHPFLEYFGTVTPSSLFLSRSISNRNNMPLLKKENDDWIINQGSINGLEISTFKNQTIYIFKKDDLKNPIGEAIIKNIYLEETTIIPTWKYSTPTKRDIIYIGIPLKQFTINLRIKEGVRYEQNNFIEPLKVSNFIISAQSKYEIIAKEDLILIYRKTLNYKEFLIGIRDKKHQPFNWLSHQLQQIQKWETILQLTTPRFSKIPIDTISFYFSYWSLNKKKTVCIQDHNTIQHITIPFNPKNSAILYQIDVKHQHSHIHGLYFYLIHLDRKYRITQKYEHFIKPLLRGISTTLYNSKETGNGLGISDNSVPSVEDTFILIASETQLSKPYFFHQHGFDKNFGKITNNTSPLKNKGEVRPGKIFSNNWVVKKLTIKLINDNTK